MMNDILGDLELYNTTVKYYIVIDSVGIDEQPIIKHLEMNKNVSLKEREYTGMDLGYTVRTGGGDGLLYIFINNIETFYKSVDNMNHNLGDQVRKSVKEYNRNRNLTDLLK